MKELKEEYTVSELSANIKIAAVRNQTKGKAIRLVSSTCRHIYCNLNGVTNDQPINYPSTSSNSVDQTDYINLNIDRLSTENSIKSQKDKLVSQTPAVNNTPKKKPKVQKSFTPYWSKNLIDIGLLNGELLQGPIRINGKNPQEAYFSNADSSQQDFLIQTILDRNRALEGDIVVIKFKPKEEWTEKQKTAVVVGISEKVHSRMAIGFVKASPQKNKKYLLFVPRDRRIPKIKVPIYGCPVSLVKDPQKFENVLFRVKLRYWETVDCAFGIIIDRLGDYGNLSIETQALLLEYNLDVKPFPPELLKCVTVNDVISQEEMLYRKDMRKECVFTIDPLTARDLDDAVSCKELNNGNLEVGVHISDVAFFLTEGTSLDAMTRKKATTIYLVNDVYHMLPLELCLNCSLLPGSEKRAFSVFWEITKSGEVLSHYFNRTLIRSCTQLAYEHAQAMIDDPNHVFKEGELPPIYGGYTVKDLSRIINYLQTIAVKLRAKRFENGALSINQPKLSFKLDENTGVPINYMVYENQEANRLIEEFMLLANMTVANQILQHYPDIAFLRRHKPPNQRLLEDLKKSLKPFDVDLDMSSSKGLQTSLLNISNDENDCKIAVLNHLVAKSMTRACYFCTGEDNNFDSYFHYALHIPIYTHFTSPIRRYADIMVHRLLAATLGFSPKPKWELSFVTAIANNCNKQKYNAKCAGEASTDLYLAHYVERNQPFEKSAIVIDLRQNCFDILVPETGSIIRMHFNAFGEEIQCIQEEFESQRKMKIIFPKTSEFCEDYYDIQLFSIIKVNLTRKAKTNKLEAHLLRPITSQIFTSNST